MKFKGTILSKRTVALFAAAILLLSSGGFLGTKALPTITGQNYDASIDLDDISVQIWENGSEVKDGVLMANIKDAKPGMTYKENISVKNNGSAPEYVRLVVRKYWTNDGKDTTLDPGLIALTPSSEWKENKAEATSEMSVYYLSDPLAVNGESTAIKSVCIKRDIMNEVDVKKVKKTDGDETRTTITYTYKYDGYTFHVEAEAQAVQSHNAQDAIKSIWGVNAGDVGINLVD